MKTSIKQFDGFQLLCSLSLLVMTIIAFGQMSLDHSIIYPKPDWNELRVLSTNLFLAVSLLLCSIFTFPSIHGVQSGVEIPRVPTWIPWLGHALRYSFDSANFLVSSRQRYGSIFRFQVGGKNIIAISQPTAVSNVLRSTKFDVVEFQMLQYLSGIKDSSRMPLIFSVGHLKAIATAGRALSPLHLRSVATTFNIHLLELLGDAAPRTDGSEVTLSITDFVRRNMFTATSIAFMGPHFLEENSYNDFVLFDEGVVSLLRRLPFGKGEAKAARERQVDEMAKFLKRYWREEDGGYIEGAGDSFMSDVIRGMKTSGLTDEEVARLQFTFMWGSHANQSQVCIWVVHHLLADPNMFARIQDEIQGLLNGKFSNIMTLVHADPRDLEEKTFPFLTSAIQECLRVTSLATSLRQALVDVDIMGENNQPIRIRKGEIVLADVLNMHTNEEYFEDPSIFKFDRFASNGGDSTGQNKALLPFGKGIHVCAGRYFAMHAIRMFVILCFHFYEFGPSPSQNSLPPVDPSSFITIARSREDRPIVLRRRQLL